MILNDIPTFLDLNDNRVIKAMEDGNVNTIDNIIKQFGNTYKR
jgi:hypothetical protein